MLVPVVMGRNMEEPGRPIQTTVVYEDKAASFIFIEGLDRSVLVELANEGLARPLSSAGGEFLRSVPDAITLAALAASGT
jgi:hypothetical protein